MRIATILEPGRLALAAVTAPQENIMCNDPPEDAKHAAALVLARLLAPEAEATKLSAFAAYLVLLATTTMNIAADEETGGYGAIEITIVQGTLALRAAKSYPRLRVA